MPLDPLTVGSIVEGGTSILGGLTSKKANRRAVRAQMAFQKEFAQHGIRWRAEDAKAAGLHPLFAMGAQIPSATPVAFEDAMGPALASAGQGVSRAMMAKVTPMERQAHAMGIEVAKSTVRSNDAMAAYYASLAALNSSGNKASPTMDAGEGFGTGIPGQTLLTEKDSARSGEFISAAPIVPQSSTKEGSVLAGGDRPGWMWSDIGNGLRMLIPADPSGSVTESREALGEDVSLMLQTIAENTRVQGWPWFWRFIDSHIPGEGVPVATRWGHAAGRATRRFIEQAVRGLVSGSSASTWPRQPTLR